jgi:tetratricopeptide (TPR) repeat protein
MRIPRPIELLPAAASLAGFGAWACAPSDVTGGAVPDGDVAAYAIPADLDARVQRILERELENVRAHPEDAAARGTLGLVYEANGLWSEAEAAFAEAARLDPAAAEWRYHRALALRQLGRLDEGRALLEAVAAERPDSPAYRHRLGDVLLDQGDATGALAHFRAAAELAGERAEGWAGVGAAEIALGDFEAARVALEQALGRDPDYKHAHYLLGLALRGLGRNEEAKVALGRGLDGKARALPDELEGRKVRYAASTSARVERAVLLMEAGHADRALKILERLAQSEPEDVIVINDLAAAHMRLGHLEEALGLLRRASELDPERPLTWINTSICLADMGLARRALENADRAVALAPGLAGAHAARGRALADLGELEEAWASFARAKELDPRDADVLRGHAAAARALAKGDEARASYRALVELRPDDLEAWIALGEVACEAGDREEAVRAASGAQRVAPGDPRAAALLERAKGL